MKPAPAGEPGASDESSRGRVRSGTERTVTGALEATALPELADSTLPGAGGEAPPARVADPLGVAPTRPNAEAALSPAASAPQPSTLRPFAPYTRVEVLAQQGSIGLVARGFNEGFGRWELLKFLRPELAQDPEIVRQFRREGRVLAQLSHPNVVQVFATHLVDDRHCLALEFLEGRTLAAELEESGGRLPFDAGLELFADAARGLAAAHEAGLLHRDLKPDNLFVCARGKGRAGGLKLIDFGLATAARGAPTGDRELESETVGGTPLYMAPELWLGHDGSARSDLWALGTTFYRALGGAHPVGGTTIDAVRGEILSPAPFRSIATLRPELPPALARVIDRLVAKPAQERFESASELVAVLAGVREGARPRRLPDAGPYRGLSPYTESDRDVLFGREADAVEVVERLRSQAAVLLVGPAAAGKTSLARAGVAPLVREGALGGGLSWEVAVVVPGARPVRSLAAALARPLAVGEEEIRGLLGREPERLGEATRASLPPAAGLVLIVDPVDDLVCGAEPGESRAVAVALASLLDAGVERVRVIGCAAIERLDRLAELAPLRLLVSRGVHPVRPLRGDSLRRAILEPARVAGYTLEDLSVADAIVAEAATLPAALPLVSLALRDWWESRTEADRRLGTAAWTSIGGLVGALVRHAEAAHAALSPEDQAGAIELLARLCGPERQPLCLPRGALVDPVASGARAASVLERLLAAKVVVESTAGIELAHEALARAWPRLRAAARVSRGDREMAERVRRAAAEWAGDRRTEGALWDGEAAERLLGWFAETSAPLGQSELEFIEAVRRRRAARKFAARATWLAVAIAGVALGLWSKAGERRVVSELERTRQARLAERSAHAIDVTRLLVDRARLALGTDPRGALEAIQRAAELGPDPVHDTLAWRARITGIARALPPHAGGVEQVAPLGVAHVLTAGADAQARLLGVSGPEVLTVGPLPRRATAWSAPVGGGIATGDATGALHLVDSGGKVRSLGSCGGAVRRVLLGASERLVAECEAKGGGDPAEARWMIAGPASAPAEVLPRVRASAGAPGEPWAAALTGERLVWLDLAGGRVGDEVRAQGATALGVAEGAGRAVWIGDDRGRLRRVEPGEPTREPRAALVSRTIAVSGARWSAIPGRADSLVERAFAVDARGRAALVDGEAASVATFEGVASVSCWLPSRGALAFARRDGSVTIVSAHDGVVLGRLLGATREVTGLALAAAGGSEWLVVGSADGGVRAWSLDTASARVVAPPHRSVGEVTGLAQDGSAYVRARGERVEVRRAGTRADRRAPETREFARATASGAGSLAAGPLGRTTAWLDGDSWLVRADGGAVARLVERPRCWAVGGDGGVVVAVRSEGDGYALVASREPGKLEAVTALPGPVDLIDLHAGDTQAALADARGEVRTVDLAGGRLLSEIRLGVRALPTALAANEHGSVALGTADGHVAIRRRGGGGAGAEEDGGAAGDGRTEHGFTVSLGTAAVSCLVWASGGRALAAGLANGELRVLDTDTRESFEVFRASSPVVACVRRARSDDLLVLDAAGTVHERVLELGLAWLGQPPEDPLDPARAGGFGWAGLAER